ncbi:MAG: leucine-rich repeat domain-containing protein [Minicystis sp.]
MQGNFERSLAFDTWFRVPAERYLASWQKALEHVRASGGAFDDLDAALADPERVTALVLGHAGLDALSPEIGRLVNIQHLNLFMNRLTTLPPEIGRLKRLRWVDLRYNRITTLPETCASLEALESINLAGNRLEAIPDWVATLPKLTTFYVSSNPIEPASLEHVRRLRPDLSFD